MTNEKKVMLLPDEFNRQPSLPELQRTCRNRDRSVV